MVSVSRSASTGWSNTDSSMCGCRAVLAWAESYRAGRVGLWVNEANRPAISLYEKAGFRRTGEVDKLPSDPAQQEIRMLRRVDSRGLASAKCDG
jgi:hypothetical protein